MSSRKKSPMVRVFSKSCPSRGAANRRLSSKRAIAANADEPRRPVPRAEALESRVLLSGYTLNQIAVFGVNASGANPTSTLVVDSSGNFYGTAANGGGSGDGT